MSNHKKKTKSQTALFSFILAASIIIIAYLVLFRVSFFFNNSSGGGYSFIQTKQQAPLENASKPNRLIIPSIGVNAFVQETALDSAGRMGIPTNFTDTAWYKLGPKPGERGNAVVDGHLDTARDANAVFIRLSELKAGDEILVEDFDKNKLRFRVTELAIYDEKNAPLEKIFGQGGETARLNLITCDGVWNEKQLNYDKRLVVYSTLVGVDKN